MYAIVDIAGQQIKVEKDQKIFVNRLEGAEGSQVSFDKVLLFENDGNVKVGTPVVENCVVSATIVAHVKGDKVLVFKKKRRKGYQKMNGHRQHLTQLLIEGIGEEKKAPKKAATKSDAKVEEKIETKAVKEAETEVKEVKAKKESKKEVKETKAKTAPKTEKKTPVAKKDAPKKAAPKKAAPKKTTAPKAKKEDTATKTGKTAPKTKSKE